MSFAGQVFISYTHKDNQVAPGVPRGWVDQLHEYLEFRLPQLLGGSPKIWRDKAAIKGNDVLRDTIAIGIHETSILLSVLSPLYLNSTWCREELDGFLQAASLNRLFKVIKTPVALPEQPEPMQKALGYEFYALDPNTKRFREFDHTISSNGEKDKRYWDKLDDLAQDICALLKALQGEPLPKSGPTIFLAETTSDLAEQRDKVRRELQQSKHLILPDKPLPTNKPQLESSVRDCLQRSRLSVHLIGEHYGLVPEMESERSVIWLQQDLARERGDNAEFSRLIWMPPGLEPKDDRQRRFIETLQNAFHSTNGSDLIQTKIEDLKTIIQEKLNPTPKPTASEKPNDGPQQIYLVCDKRDVEEIGNLYSYLYEEGCEVLLPDFDENTMQADKQNMLDCDAVLFYFASPPEIWLRTRLKNLTGFGRTKPLDAVGVYVTGAETMPKKLFQTREAIVMKNFGAFDETPLKPFMQQLSQAKGGAR